MRSISSGFLRLLGSFGFSVKQVHSVSQASPHDLRTERRTNFERNATPPST
jgi:hypothetical protein